MKYNESLKGQEATLESSKGFYRGRKSNHTVLSTHSPKSMIIYQKIYGK